MSDDSQRAHEAVATVRTARNEDLTRLLAIQAAAFPDPNRTLLRSAVRAGLALVAVDGPVASGGVAAPDPVGYALFTADEASVYVAELAVAPGHRRRGHGARLLAAVAARYTDRERLRLTTRADNEAARSFYASLGFRTVEELPGYYGDEDADDPDPADGVLLVRDLE
jgi:ribosomal-protein-alanine N-acetyltransferase